MKLFARICALGLVALALIGIFVVRDGGILGRYPMLHWTTWLRWPMAILWVWLAVRLWRNPHALAGRAFRARTRAVESRPS